jgi:DNA helicase-2/ATP-dependent DNA helicase PcrA
VDVLGSLNQQQQEAVTTTEGPVLILAGAGSGKTKALTHRIAYLMGEKGVRPSNILAVTFTNKAAGEMRDRVNKLLTSSLRPTPYAPHPLPWLGTFHSICVKILRREIESLDYSKDFTIFDSDDSLRAIKKSMKELALDEKKYNARAVRSYISGAKGELMNAKQYAAFAFDHFQEIVSQVYFKYEKMLKVHNALDFDDLIFRTVELFQKHPETLNKYQSIFRYILVDEYQDTNHAQYIFLELLASKHRNIFAIGDDWQSIYSFRGAKFQNILDFKKDYPDAKIIYLEQNYRSRTPIIESAQAVIKNNEMRSDKNLFTTRDGGAPVLVLSAENKNDEIDFILDEISAIKVGEGRELREFVILFRTNAQSRAYEEALNRRQIPYRIVGALKFYERKEIKDVLAYLRFANNPTDTISLARIINVVPRGIGDKTLDKILTLGDEAENQIPKFKSFMETIRKIRGDISKNQRPDLLIDSVMRHSGYRDFLNDGSFESANRLENIEELKNVASEFEDLNSFLESVALVSDIDELKETDNFLTLMTIHAAKGLEYPIVFISGLEEGTFPHSGSQLDQYELEEERRLFYVGMTRAMERLYISYAKTKYLYGQLQFCVASRFIAELPEEHVENIEI